MSSVCPRYVQYNVINAPTTPHMYVNIDRNLGLHWIMCELYIIGRTIIKRPLVQHNVCNNNMFYSYTIFVPLCGIICQIQQSCNYITLIFLLSALFDYSDMVTVSVSNHGRPQEFFQGGGQTFGGGPQKNL